MRLTIVDPSGLLSVVMDREVDRSDVEQIERTLDYASRQDEENLRGAALARRIAAGQCAILGRTCLTHNMLDDPGHAFDTSRLGTLD